MDRGTLTAKLDQIQANMHTSRQRRQELLQMLQGIERALLQAEGAAILLEELLAEPLPVPDPDEEHTENA